MTMLVICTTKHATLIARFSFSYFVMALPPGGVREPNRPHRDVPLRKAWPAW